MILDRLENAEKYFALHQRLAPGFEFLRRPDLSSLTDGNHQIDGQRIYVHMRHWQVKGRAGSKVEMHRTHIDIHFPISRWEEIGWKSQPCKQVSKTYDPQKDIEFFADPIDSWITVPVGSFAIFFPQEAHAPEAVEGELHKGTVKILV
jgi:YhcH/YjgK/YiaL family protein